MRCSVCNETISSKREIAAFEIKGWEKERVGGGTNHVMFRKRTGGVMCSTCLVKLTHGVTPDQLTLT